MSFGGAPAAVELQPASFPQRQLSPGGQIYRSPAFGQRAGPDCFRLADIQELVA